MVKIRLTRRGKKGQPHYRVIAINARTKREGDALEYLGYYNPRTNPLTLKLDAEKIKEWLAKGAQPTKVVEALLVKEKIISKKSEKKVYKSAPGRKMQERTAAKEAKAKAGVKEEKKAEATA